MFLSYFLYFSFGKILNEYFNSEKVHKKYGWEKNQISSSNNLCKNHVLRMAYVGDIDYVTISREWSIVLPLKNGYDLVMTAICINSVTVKFQLPK